MLGDLEPAELGDGLVVGLLILEGSINDLAALGADQVVVPIAAIVEAIGVGHPNLANQVLTFQNVQIAIDGPSAATGVYLLHVLIDLIRGGMVTPRPYGVQNHLLLF